MVWLLSILYAKWSISLDEFKGQAADLEEVVPSQNTQILTGVSWVRLFETVDFTYLTLLGPSIQKEIPVSTTSGEGKYNFVS